MEEFDEFEPGLAECNSANDLMMWDKKWLPAKNAIAGHRGPTGSTNFAWWGTASVFVTKACLGRPAYRWKAGAPWFCLALMLLLCIPCDATDDHTRRRVRGKTAGRFTALFSSFVLNLVLQHAPSGICLASKLAVRALCRNTRGTTILNLHSLVLECPPTWRLLHSHLCWPEWPLVVSATKVMRLLGHYASVAVAGRTLQRTLEDPLFESESFSKVGGHGGQTSNAQVYFPELTLIILLYF